MLRPSFGSAEMPRQSPRANYAGERCGALARPRGAPILGRPGLLFRKFFALSTPAGIIVCQLNHGDIFMSRVNGDKARFHRERKKSIARREGIRQMLQAAGITGGNAGGKKAAAPAAKKVASVEK
jgi:hypothetical protein